MPPKMRHGLLISLVVISLIVIAFNTSYPDTTNYIYDELNRLIRVEYGDGNIIEYIYDNTGNRSHAYVGKYTLTVNVVGSGTVTKNPDQPIYGSGTNVTLTAVDGSQTFSEWSGDLGGSTNPTVIEMNGNKSVTATFVPWLQGWTYRKPVTLSRASGAVTNYQMRLLVGESSGASGEDVDCNGHVQADFDDLRFTTSDGTTFLNYWIESISGTSPNQLATVWIEFDSIGTGATTFYMYYGKADASAYSNGDDTFLLFDHFLSIDLVKWTNSGSFTQATSEILKNASNTNAIYLYQSVIQYTAPLAIEAKCRSGQTGQYSWIWALLFDSAWATTGYLGGHFKDAGNDYTKIFKFGTGAASQQTNEGYTTADYRYSLRIGAVTQTLYVDNNLKGSISTSIQTNPAYVILATTRASGSSSFVAYFDFVAVRNYRDTEPVWGSWGAEESN